MRTRRHEQDWLLYGLLAMIFQTLGQRVPWHALVISLR